MAWPGDSVKRDWYRPGVEPCAPDQSRGADSRWAVVWQTCMELTVPPIGSIIRLRLVPIGLRAVTTLHDPLKLGFLGIWGGCCGSSIDRRSHAQRAGGYASHDRRHHMYMRSTAVSPFVYWGAGRVRLDGDQMTTMRRLVLALLDNRHRVGTGLDCGQVLVELEADKEDGVGYCTGLN